MRKIAIFQSDLNVGGIQKSLINLLNNIDASHFDIDLYIFNKVKFFEKEIPDYIHLIYLDPFPKFTKLIPFFIVKNIYQNRFQKIDKIYDLAIDFNSYWHECAVGALSVNANKRVMWIHNDVEKKLAEDKKYRVLWKAFKGKFAQYDEFVAVSDGIIPSFLKMSHVENKKVITIPNFIDTKEISQKSQEEVDISVDSSKYNFVTMGRLCHQKGFDILVEYFEKLIRQRKDIHLYIIGDGPDRHQLEQQIRNLHLSEYITLLGNKPNPFPYMKQMDGFVLTSRYEGQGIVIWEAKSLGLSIFITKNLEKYNRGIAGYDDIVMGMYQAQKKEKKFDFLNNYNDQIKKSVEALLQAEYQ